MPLYLFTVLLNKVPACRNSVRQQGGIWRAIQIFPDILTQLLQPVHDLPHLCFCDCCNQVTCIWLLAKAKNVIIWAILESAVSSSTNQALGILPVVSGSCRELSVAISEFWVLHLQRIQSVSGLGVAVVTLPPSTPSPPGSSSKASLLFKEIPRLLCCQGEMKP